MHERPQALPRSMRFPRRFAFFGMQALVTILPEHERDRAAFFDMREKWLFPPVHILVEASQENAPFGV
jgi:hypothetical protein